VSLTIVHQAGIVAGMTTKSETKGTAERPVEKLAFSYRRYSSQNQTENSSLERQRQENETVCLEKGWKLIDLPPDKGVSAYKITDLDEQMAANFHKGTLGAFLKRVKKGEIPKGSVLMVERLDRFSRNYFDLVFPVWLELLQSGIEIFSSVSRTLYTLEEIRKNPMLAAMALIELANANKYSQELGNKITKSFNIRLALCQQGMKMNLGSWTPRWIDFIGDSTKPGQFKLNDHAKTIERICLEYLSGQSMYKIARGLIADKVPTLLGGKWAQGTVANLLRHQGLTGNIVIKGIELKNYYPALITQIQFNKLQAKLSENRQRKGGAGASDYIANLFRNRCRCALCGETITTAKSSSSRLYTCKGKRVGKCSSKYSIKVEDLERDFFLDFLQSTPKALLTKNTTEHSDKAATLQATIAKLDKGIADLTELVGIKPIEEIKSKLLKRDNEREQVKNEMVKLNTTMLSSTNAPKAFLDIQLLLDTLGTEEAVKHIEKNMRMVSEEEMIRISDEQDAKAMATLRDNSVRQRLLQLLPSIVKGLVIDTTKKQYAIVSHNGSQSDWRKVPTPRAVFC
jgi:Recombinase/Resolvase, N terminal domain